MRILIADDDITSRTMLERMTTKWGWTPVPMDNGAEAWRIMAAPDAPPFAVLDWNMPGLEGPEVCQNIRTGPNAEETYIILLTSRDQRGDIVAGLEAGADDYITKPIDPEELRARLGVGERVVRLHQSREAVATACRRAAELNRQALLPPLTPADDAPAQAYGQAGNGAGVFTLAHACPEACTWVLGQVSLRAERENLPDTLRAWYAAGMRALCRKTLEDIAPQDTIGNPNTCLATVQDALQRAFPEPDFDIRLGLASLSRGGKTTVVTSHPSIHLYEALASNEQSSDTTASLTLRTIDTAAGNSHTLPPETPLLLTAGPIPSDALALPIAGNLRSWMETLVDDETLGSTGSSPHGILAVIPRP